MRFIKKEKLMDCAVHRLIFHLLCENKNNNCLEKSDYLAIIKVSTSIFSTIKTISRAIEKSTRDDEIMVAAGKYKESLHIDKNLTIKGKDQDTTILVGIIIVPKNTTVHFYDCTIQPTNPIFIEGKAIFHRCTFIGDTTNIIISTNKGQLTLNHCIVKLSKEVGIALLNNSEALIDHCFFETNGKTHVLIEHSHLQLTNSTLISATHALWLKSNAKAITRNNKLQYQQGTQIVVQESSILEDTNSMIEHGQGNGIYAINQSRISLQSTVMNYHALSQLWIQNSMLQATNCTIQQGKESGIMLRDYAEAAINDCLITHHKFANIQATLSSCLNIESSKVQFSEGVGIQLKEQSIANLIQTTIEQSTLAQLFVTEKSIVSLKECTFLNGQHVGIFLEKNANCTIIDSKMTQHINSAISVIHSELFMMHCHILNNEGNGILAAQQAKVIVDHSKFIDNVMPHIAAKTNADITIQQCELIRGKGIYILDSSTLSLYKSAIYNSEGVQIEVTDHTKLLIEDSQIYSGSSNGIKALRNCEVHIKRCQISEHRLPQIVINDSSLIFLDSELKDGRRNGMIIENHSEALIEDSIISKHIYPQIWIDLESDVEIKHTHLTEGSESDIYVQNKSTAHVDKCIIQNNQFPLNIQAIQQSKVNLHNSLVENHIGESYYFDIDSSITHYLDEVDY